jgi:chromosome segregation ATPase
MPKRSKKRNGSSGKHKSHSPGQTLKGLRKQVKVTRASVKERVQDGIRANRKAGSKLRDRAVELRERLAQEAKRRLDIEHALAKRDEELKALEMKLDHMAEAQAPPKPKGGKVKALSVVGSTKGTDIIYTSKHKHQRKGTGPSTQVEDYRDLLEKRIVAEDDELALVKQQLYQLQEREQCLNEREDKLKAVETALKEESCTPSTGIQEMKDGLEERLDILEQRNKRLDLLEAELARMERFVDKQVKTLSKSKPKAKKKFPLAPKKKKSRSSDEEE